MGATNLSIYRPGRGEPVNGTLVDGPGAASTLELRDMDFRLSVLDLSPVSSGSNGAQALHNTLELARLTDQLGYERYWLAEHHNLPSVASSAPEVMIGHVASETSRIRVGAGGIMLPNHAPLRVV